MSKTVYLKLRQLTKTNKKDVYLSDIADVYADKKLLARIKSIKVVGFYKVKKDSVYQCHAAYIVHKPDR